MKGQWVIFLLTIKNKFKYNKNRASYISLKGRRVMKKYFLAGAMLMSLHLNAGVVDVNLYLDVDITVQTCTGAGSTCSIVKGGKINAIGNVETIDVSKESITSFGKLDKTEQRLELDIPTAVDGLEIYSFVPTKGEMAGKLIYLTLHNEPQAPGSRLAGKDVIKLLRQVKGDKADKWIEVGSIIKNKTKVLKTLPFFVTADATFYIRDYNNQNRVEFRMGDLVIKSEEVKSEQEKA